MTLKLSELGEAYIHTIAPPPVRNVFFAVEEAHRQASARQSGAADAAQASFGDYGRAEASLSFLRSTALYGQRAVDPVALAAAERAVERAEVQHQNAHALATSETKISSARRQTREDLVGFVNGLALATTPVKFGWPSVPKERARVEEISKREAEERPRVRQLLRETQRAETTLQEDLANAETDIAEMEVAGAMEPVAVKAGGKFELRFSTKEINAEPDSPGGFAVQIDAIPFVVSMFPDEVRNRVFRQIREYHERSPGVLRLARAEKAKRVMDLKAKIDASERVECACIIALAGDATAIHFPSDASPAAILGVTGFAWQRH